MLIWMNLTWTLSHQLYISHDSTQIHPVLRFKKSLSSNNACRAIMSRRCNENMEQSRFKPDRITSDSVFLSVNTLCSVKDSKSLFALFAIPQHGQSSNRTLLHSWWEWWKLRVGLVFNSLAQSHRVFFLRRKNMVMRMLSI